METPRKRAGRDILARNLRRLRRERGVTQEALAHQVNLTQTYLSEVEAGKRNISIDNIEILADAFGLSLSALLEEG
ncbi:helix-turn-helix transcriptional regulator [Rhodoblastus sp. 17X3]|uniref:helix-turn-helix domain-containing protein n=1 Tax=Rhodoblastus sp. 17X3 TaxID=3047026 RepID=UPI0024B7D17A|nr:helix-turn-helix transcriptional regulator [Rhodoblastus sp. 17X3]MDI9847645.1 helix-turn-helix transcriptional regulator [Rhodoblastus sp. 17X3]